MESRTKIITTFDRIDACHVGVGGSVVEVLRGKNAHKYLYRQFLNENLKGRSETEPEHRLQVVWAKFIRLQISATKWGGLGLQYRLPARIFLYKQEGLCPPFCIWNHFVVDSFQIIIFIL